ncbi:MAG: TonB-dependent receptor [Gemmatimonadetes bacterium]|uniref:TonB-dependent receptor n=1 Tax=Candidatus Kutchimonas denitrificans TaxID=3056748 RepID=A0AAE4Z8V7_9BACT|nr:TonB-dependent receptor [Gemmatimonadota bacterium]NIR74316.1 TonB-dependent receptor [Candidatus Kutchimonas denitrificans]NIS01372.1 TonB-dependent receptor [Gemmatimonadota bacterium]NIT67112.1 TonB-dependent receptor [Gemmatimonadota bacterium]NIU52768.1 TonB-dependent receptor [Gemmatimonadota bacterium]
MRHIVPFLVAALCIPSTARAQGTGTVAGRVLDADSRAPVATAAVRVKGTVLIAFADHEGRFVLGGVPAGTRHLSLERIGYAPGEAVVEVESGGTVRVEIELEPRAVAMGEIVAAVVKRSSLSTESPVSVAVVEEEEVLRRVSETVADAVAYVPSAQFVGEQLNIRGSSGYARGTGSRVLLLIDGVPANAGDSGAINWDVLPVIEVERIEVVKGAGSALYGSAALGGVVNVVTARPPEQPLTKLRLRGGFYDDPPFPEWIWANQTLGYASGELTHGRRFGDFGAWVQAGQWFDDGYRQAGNLERTTLSTQMELASSRDTLTVFGSWASERYGSALLWCIRGECRDDSNLAYQPLRIPTSARDDRTRSDKARAHLIHERRWSESFNSRLRFSYQRNDWETDFGDELLGSVADVFGSELQLGWQAASWLYLIGGGEGSYTTVEANLFGGHDMTGAAGYLQAELGVLPWLTLTTGARYDRVWVDGTDYADELSPRAGLVLRPHRYTRIRASAGRGFRAPTVAELFTATEVGGFLVIPNDSLLPERSITTEVGIRQLLTSWLSVDVAGFHYDLDNYIEPDTVATPEGEVTIRFGNVPSASIRGIEAIALTSFFRDRLIARVAYTYLDTEEDATGQALAYRPTHMVTAAGTFTLGRLELSADYRYASAYDRVKVFTNPRTDPIVPQDVLDLRAAYRFGEQVIRFTVDNSLNYAYTTIERNLEPIRRYTLSLELQF